MTRNPNLDGYRGATARAAALEARRKRANAWAAGFIAAAYRMRRFFPLQPAPQ
jgi:hypothetical protein